MVAFIPDISKGKHAGTQEAVLQQGEAPKRSFNGKTILDTAGGIAHDFNNLLYPIIGYTQMTINDMPEGSQARNNLEAVLKAAGRAQDLIRHFLNFHLHGENAPKPLQIQLVIKEVLNFIRASQPKTIEVRENIDKACGLVMADPIQIHRIIMNLCTNACRAMQSTGGTLEVGLSKIDIGIENSTGLDLDPGAYLRIKVKDTGQGIDHAIIGRIFDPFFTTKKEDKGAGLGLFVVLEIVRSYGGNISVSSLVRKGTEVDVYLPRIDTEEKRWRQIESIDAENKEKITVGKLRDIQGGSELNLLT